MVQTLGSWIQAIFKIASNIKASNAWSIQHQKSLINKWKYKLASREQLTNCLKEQFVQKLNPDATFLTIPIESVFLVTIFINDNRPHNFLLQTSDFD